MAEELNTRILVIDDEESVRDSFRTVLEGAVRDERALDAAASALFGDSSPPRAAVTMRFHVEVVTNGRDGVERVRRSVVEGRPYAVVFCDMRMPGLDGVETVEEIRKLDQRAQVVFVTAYSDHSIETVVERAGADVGYFVKPFLTDEMKQLATRLVLEWNKARELEDMFRTITAVRADARDTNLVLLHVLEQLCAWLETDSAALFRLDARGDAVFRLGVGQLGDSAMAAALAERARSGAQAMYQLGDGTTFLPVPEFGMAIALSGRARITPDRRYLLQVFLDHAALAIRTDEMRSRLAEQERLALVGHALAFVLHDIRGPVGSVQTYTRLLREDREDPEAVGEALEHIDRCTQRALDTVSDALAICRGKIDVMPAVIDVAATVRAAALTWRVDMEHRKITVDVDVPDALEGFVDRERLERALWNLVRHAAEALAGYKHKHIRVGAARSGSQVDVWVEDNGPNVTPEAAESLFQPFADASVSGWAGFGLAIVRQIALAHGGAVDVGKGPMGGTRFTLRFPDRPHSG